LNRDRHRFEAAGVRLVVIGMGTPGNARHFRESHGLELELLMDADRRAYKAAGAKKATFGELLGPRVVAKGLRRALSSRVHQGMTVGHPAQLGGVMIVMPDGSVPWVHLSDDAADNPPNELVLEAVRRATDG
jgi:hypothetical protein